MEAGAALLTGDVVQLDEAGVVGVDGTRDMTFAGCFMLVTKVHPRGARGFINVPDEKGALPWRAYYWAAWEEMKLIGHAEWIPVDLEEEA